MGRRQHIMSSARKAVNRFRPAAKTIARTAGKRYIPGMVGKSINKIKNRF